MVKLRNGKKIIEVADDYAARILRIQKVMNVTDWEVIPKQDVDKRSSTGASKGKASS
jgi:hypothetical protein